MILKHAENDDPFDGRHRLVDHFAKVTSGEVEIQIDFWVSGQLSCRKFINGKDGHWLDDKLFKTKCSELGFIVFKKLLHEVFNC